MELAERRQAAHRVALFADRDRIAREPARPGSSSGCSPRGCRCRGAASLIPGTEAAGRVQRGGGRPGPDDQGHPGGDLPAPGPRVTPRRRAFSPASWRSPRRMTRALGFAPWLRMDGRLDARVPGHVAQEMLAVLREALSNVARHAAASQADVSVETGAARLVLMVRDNGIGIREPGPRSGLANLAERAERLGGSLRVTAAEWRRHGAGVERAAAAAGRQDQQRINGPRAPQASRVAAPRAAPARGAAALSGPGSAARPATGSPAPRPRPWR